MYCFKLVRDGIVGELRGRNDVLITKAKKDMLDDLLRVKVLEEVIEFVLRPSIEEVVDILEALNSWLRLKGLRLSDLEKLRSSKLRARGGFDGGYLVLWRSCRDMSEFLKLNEVMLMLKELQLRIIDRIVDSKFISP